MMTFLIILLGVVAGFAAAAAYKRRGNSGDRGHHGPAQTGYESGVTRHNGDTTGMGGL
ncbi:hypothetical protein BJY16_001695 [Actinoplanes octamycinicus]|uniref:Uncharacterized protein n=1 Tax=Actinoplanes octamycinicus TaxID=135948 RepID=A0A7W7GU01_9ACTN|nr:hypothetical protein [Actinoplanes octamycinicus]MBB4738236.1 hypothetical protein [Actinoplanes octamycinicus]GIE59203.1 hypothetical protein Aoc01nite_46050 [Actinoplanes octamycinicus]